MELREKIHFDISSESFSIYRSNKHKKGPNTIDEMELVANEQEVDRTPPVNNGQNNTEDVDSESDTDSIPDVSNERGLRFHLKKKSELTPLLRVEKMFI